MSATAIKSAPGKTHINEIPADVLTRLIERSPKFREDLARDGNTPKLALRPTNSLSDAPADPAAMGDDQLADYCIAGFIKIKKLITMDYSGGLLACVNTTSTQ